MNDFLSFKYMITPGVLKIVCYIGMVVAFIGGIVTIMADPISGIIVTLLGPIAVRISTELTLVIFEIHGELKRINNNSE